MNRIVLKITGVSDNRRSRSIVSQVWSFGDGSGIGDADAVSENVLTMQLNMVVALLATWLSRAASILSRDNCEKLLEMYFHYLEQQQVIKYD